MGTLVFPDHWWHKHSVRHLLKKRIETWSESVISKKRNIWGSWNLVSVELGWNWNFSTFPLNGECSTCSQGCEVTAVSQHHCWEPPKPGGAPVSQCPQCPQSELTQLVVMGPGALSYNKHNSLGKTELCFLRGCQCYIKVWSTNTDFSNTAINLLKVWTFQVRTFLEDLHRYQDQERWLQWLMWLSEYKLMDSFPEPNASGTLFKAL